MYNAVSFLCERRRLHGALHVKRKCATAEAFSILTYPSIFRFQNTISLDLTCLLLLSATLHLFRGPNRLY